MSSIPQDVLPIVSAEDVTALQQAVVRFDREQLIWSSGYLAGLAGSAAPDLSLPDLAANPAGTAPSTQGVTWHVFYATETGNSRRIAEKLATKATQAGLSIQLQDLRDARPKVLKNVENAVFVLATHGIGEAPEGSELFFEYWMSDKAPRLEQLSFSVLALGDSSYVDFCELGRTFDARLRELGASAVVDRIDCDLDFDTPSADWTAKVIDHVRESDQGASPSRAPHLSAVPSALIYDRQRPFGAEILMRQSITGRGSSKDVRHIELDLEGSGLAYQPGDSLGVMPTNPPQVVDSILVATGLVGNETVEIDGEPGSLRDILSRSREITKLSRPILDTIAASNPRLRSILESREGFSDYLQTRQLIDVVHEFPIDWEPQQFVESLRRLTPRLYSIASGPDANVDEAHLTVAVVDYEKFARQHWGSASNFLIGGATHASVYVEPNDHFRLPINGDTPIIMVGAGTGVAPFRAFVEHRREHGHTGRNWLVFGDRNLCSDFLYQLEWLRYRKEGVLANLDVAFSRDQADKIYVQHRLLENGAAIFDWLENGAHFYVCGDAELMAADVDHALLSIVTKHGNRSDEKARDYINNLKRANRYQRDVY